MQQIAKKNQGFNLNDLLSKPKVAEEEKEEAPIV